MQDTTPLNLIKALHTLVWLFFVGCIVLLPVAAHAGRFGQAALLAGFVLVEVVVLAVNRWRCPLTGVAARHTADRRDNFDIFLPLWLARNNKSIFGTLFLVGLGYTAFEWYGQTGGG